jgi:putative Mg2+ transporter-C (MgtC) family protein
MTTSLGWGEIALRLALTFIAGTLIGINRGEHGRPAGLRTTNLLLATAGKREDSFVTLDLMRLPLGILSGMGFIGGGVILKRDNLVLGVTTAATLWFVTVIGLCLGGGELVLGTIALAMGLVVLWGLKWVEGLFPQDQRATLIATLGSEAPTVDEVCQRLRSAGYQILSLGLILDTDAGKREIRCELQWQERPPGPTHLPALENLAAIAGVSRVTWNPRGIPTSMG